MDTTASPPNREAGAHSRLSHARRHLRLAGAALAVVLVAGCSATTAPDGPMPPETASAMGTTSSAPGVEAPSADLAIGEQPHGGIDLAGTSWVLSSPIGENASTNATLTFDATNASGQAPVNTYSASYTQGPDGALTFGPIATTRMAGSPEAMTAEQEYLTVLAQTFAYSSDETTLTLYGVADQVTEYTRQ